MDDRTINSEVTLSGENATVLAGRYRIIRQLGQGGMGSVWLAEDTKLDGFKVAIKMLPSVLVNNKRAYAQVKAEALVSLKLSHPNIVTVRAFEEESGSPFLVMDYVDGQTLDDYLAEKGKLTEDETVKLLKPVAAALDYAHSQGVVHRDVKPGNIMIRKDGVPFVLDFGIAREIQETMTRVTGKLSSGTLLYMSPEQVRGELPSVAQDIYSFAALLYECLSGNPPFCRGQIEYQIVNQEPVLLSSEFAIASSVMKGLAKDPDVRPSSCVAYFPQAPDASFVKRPSSGMSQRITPFRADDGRPGDSLKLDLGDGIRMTLVYCAPGDFAMGSPQFEAGRNLDERLHRVCISHGFWLGETPVTRAQWRAVMGWASEVNLPGKQIGFSDDDCPMTSVSWRDACAFAERLGCLVGSNMALPSEAQWEYACRANTVSPYSFGAVLNGDKANCNGQFPYGTMVKGDYCARTTKVRSYPPNGWGLYDMHGNVGEWCMDWYGAYENASNDPEGPEHGREKVVRGGDWFRNAKDCRSATRAKYRPNMRLATLGFRVVVNVGT